jgi:DNA-binding NarL/FixJ family response regulator
MAKQTVLEIDALTGTENVREMTEEEITQFQTIVQSSIEAQEQLNAKIAARESALAKLAALGLTEEEIAAL